MKKYLRIFFKKLWAFLVRIFLIVPYLRSSASKTEKGTDESTEKKQELEDVE
ncbi:MAG: hypothetical protein MJ060_00335 [Clostridia bacterium]|nr:hypothetical protein [Clostridia bacterium]